MNAEIIGIEEIKKMKANRFIGWSEHLIPFCEKYFNAGFSLSHIKVELLSLYQIDVHINTIKKMRYKYRANNLKGAEKQAPPQMQKNQSFEPKPALNSRSESPKINDGQPKNRISGDESIARMEEFYRRKAKGDTDGW
jgi:hypothetical protein